MRSPKGELRGAVAKYAKKAYYAVCSAHAIVHRAPLVPSPSRWWPDAVDTGEDGVCDVWYLLEDLLWHGE